MPSCTRLPCRRQSPHLHPPRLAASRTHALQAGSVAGIAGLTFASFVGVSYLEVKRKIDDQLARGEDPYELRVEARPQPPRKQAPGSKGKKKGGSSGKRK